MFIFNKDFSGLSKGKGIYKTGKILINRKDSTYLTSIVNESDSTLNPYSGSDENLNQKFAYKFTTELDNAIYFKDELEE
ncbi:hypothetical protein [Lactococcus petauri]|uniref:hypothetical protein n=1 Tax=Lactococcus petauri TaxID=1940789 RepID=UPI0038543F7E